MKTACVLSVLVFISIGCRKVATIAEDDSSASTIGSFDLSWDTDTEWNQNIWIDCEFTLDAWIRGVARSGEMCTWTDGPCSKAGYGTIRCDDEKLMTKCEGDGADDSSKECDWQTETAEDDLSIEEDEVAPPRFTYVAAGGHTTCGVLEDGRAQCWGASPIPPKDRKFTMLSISDSGENVCGLESDGNVYCFGKDYSEDAGYHDGYIYDDSAVSEVGQLSYGTGYGDFVCLIQKGGALECEGNWDEVVEMRWLPFVETDWDELLKPLEDDHFVQIASGYSHTCGLTEDGEIRCIGLDRYGADVPPDNMPCRQISSGSVLHRLKQDGTVDSIGAVVEYGERSYYVFSMIPTSDVAFLQVDADIDYACGITEDKGTIICWKQAIDEALVNDLILEEYYEHYDWRFDETLPDVPPNGGFVSLSVSGSSGCALRPDGRMQCWGFGDSGNPSGDMPLAQLSIDGGLLCGIDQEGISHCWGQDWLEGEYRDSDETFSFPPNDVQLSQVSVAHIYIDSGKVCCPVDHAHICGLLLDGTVQCWGDDNFVPEIDGDCKSISTGFIGGCCLLETGEARCWNWSGSVNDATKEKSVEVFSAPGDTRFRSISVGHAMCGIRADNNQEACWRGMVRNVWN